jgi:Icc-related predicted phosphoesterase
MTGSKNGRDNELALTRIFFATDVHGSEKTYVKFLNAASFYKSHILILGGDMTGKVIVPLVKSPDGSSGKFRGIDRLARNDSELETLEREIREAGYYPYRTEPGEMAELQADESRVQPIFKRLMLDMLKRWIQMAEERLRSTGVKIYMTGGNDDILDIKDIIRASDYVVDPEDRVVDIDGKHEMISLAWSNPTPWNTPRECSEEELWKKIEAMNSQVKNMKSCIFNTHLPPANTMISECVKLDKDLKPVFVGSEPDMISAGSTSVLKSIEHHQPLLGLHGHIHEARGNVKIGRTLCINPGSESSEGILRGVMVNLDADSVKSYLLTSG